MAFPGSVIPQVETANAHGSGDVMNDMAILVHPNNEADSVVIGTNKDATDGGLYVYNLSGTESESESLGNAYGDVELRYDFGSYANIIGAANLETGNITFFSYDFSPSARGHAFP